MTIRKGSNIIAGCASSSVNPDNKSITTNTSDKLQTVGIINQNDTTSAIKTWTGTQAEYDSLRPKTYYCFMDPYAEDTNKYYTLKPIEELNKGDIVYDENFEPTTYEVDRIIVINNTIWIVNTVSMLVIDRPAIELPDIPEPIDERYLARKPAYDTTTESQLDDNTLYWLTDGNKIYKGTTLIADNTAVDQMYDGTSVNAQSGIAVASAISGKANDTDVVHKAGDEAITGFKIHTANIEMRSTNGTQTPVLLFHIPSVRYTRLIETSNGLEVQEGGGTALDRLYVGASDAVNTAVTTVNKSKAANGYFKFGNGLIIQWGTASISGTNKTVTFPTAFTSTNYHAQANEIRSSSTQEGWGYVSSKTTTSCIFNEKDATFTWIAIGY